jgi:uncharacterized protein
MPRPIRQKTNRRRVLLVVAAIVLLVLVTSLRGLAGFYTDFLWFDSLGFGSVWRSVLWAQIGLGLLFTVIFFVLLWTNLYVADRLAPKNPPAGPEEEMVRRYHQAVGRRAGLVRIGVSLVFALIAGAGVSSQWQDWLFFTNRVDFGVADPQFGRDVGFYVFQLPFLTFVVSWAFAVILIVFVVTAAGHYLNGGIRAQTTKGSRVTPQVKAHLSLLLGLLALAKAAGYYLDQFELTFSERGFVTGATYTDLNAQLPAIRLLMIISVFSFGLLIFNIWRRGFTYPILAVGLWALVATLAGTIYPAFVQRFQVEPSESTKERPYIERNIDMTRLAMGLDNVVERDFAYQPSLSASDIADNIETVRNVRLLDPTIVGDTFQQFQGIRSFYDFRDIDVDRYEIDGQVTQVVLAARELNVNDLPNNSWESEHIAFTHGYGLAVAPANAVDANGRPDYALADIPVSARPGAEELELEQPGLYFGEDLSGYAIVGAERSEVDFQQLDDTTQSTRYEGADGVSVGGIFRRAAFALRFNEPNILISGEVQGDSRILYIRDIADRARTLAPFLKYDADPYPVIVEGRVQWILDAYTTTTHFPYAESANASAVAVGSELRSSYNYVRNSVKVVIDAYDGSVTFYVIDDQDPLAVSYRNQFPSLFSNEDIPLALREHFRYPEDLFRIQTDMWGRYRISSPDEFYDAAGAWSVSQDPGDVVGQVATEDTFDDQGVLIGRTEKRIAPQYLLMRLPGESEEAFLLFRPFVPFSEDDSRKDLQGFMIAHNDPGRYGVIEVFEMRSSTQVDGPAQFDSNINTDQEISRWVSLIDQGGSKVRPGNVLIIPIEDSLLYVRPLFVEATGGTAVPELQSVIVGIGSTLVRADTYEEALEAVVPGLDIDLGGTVPLVVVDPDAEAVPDPEETDPDDEPAPDASLMEVIEATRQAFDDADAALRDGDLAGYQAAIDRAEDLIRRAELLLPAASDPPTTTTTEPDAA